jgi:hypothetical protein
MKIAFLTIATIASLSVGQAQAQQEGSGPSPEVPELAALSGLIGQWDCKLEVKPLEGATKGGVREGNAKGEWIHNGRFLRQTWNMEAAGAVPSMSGSAIMTYEPVKKTYRSWHFVSDGSTREGTGTFDEKTKTMTWTERDSNGFRLVTKSSFPEPGIENWSITVTDVDGKVVDDLKGKNTRRK